MKFIRKEALLVIEAGLIGHIAYFLINPDFGQKQLFEVTPVT